MQVVSLNIDHLLVQLCEASGYYLLHAWAKQHFSCSPLHHNIMDCRLLITYLALRPWNWRRFTLASAGILVGLLFNPEDAGGRFLGKVWLSPNYMTLQPPWSNILMSLPSEPQIRHVLWQLIIFSNFFPPHVVLQHFEDISWNHSACRACHCVARGTIRKGRTVKKRRN
jgi:hypothetical protein